MPCEASSVAATMPASPPPITRAAFLIASLPFRRGSSNRALAAAMRTRSLAFCVAFSCSPMCTQEHWSRMLAISNR